MELRKIVLTPRHIEGKRNVAADALSREEVIPGEWELSRETFQRLEAQHGTPLQVDLFASPLNHKLPAYFCPFPFPQALGMDALVQEWNQFSQVLIFPPPNLVGEMSKKLIAYTGGGADPPGQLCPASPHPSAVPFQGAEDGFPDPTSRSGHHPGIRGVRTLSRVEFLKAIYRASFEEAVANDLISHLADSSTNQYQSAWKRFQNWLPADCTTIDKALVLSYLVSCKASMAPRTILTHRAALALPLGEGFDIDFEHKHFKMLARSAFKQNPPRAKIVPSWSLDDALQALEAKSISPDDKVARFNKALFLVACAASNRTAELAAIARKEVVFRDNDVTFRQRRGFLLKNQTQFHTPSLLRIPSLPDSPLCPVRAVRDYLADTQASTEPGLFLHPISGKTLNAGRLAYFLVKAIRWLLPDALPNAHDVRRLSTTHAFAAGVSLDKIVDAGSWRSSSTFARKYLVPCIAPSSGRAILARCRI